MTSATDVSAEVKARLGPESGIVENRDLINNYKPVSA
jgi:hypothetical protein